MLMNPSSHALLSRHGLKIDEKWNEWRVLQTNPKRGKAFVFLLSFVGLVTSLLQPLRKQKQHSCSIQKSKTHGGGTSWFYSIPGAQTRTPSSWSHFTLKCPHTDAISKNHSFSLFNQSKCQENLTFFFLCIDIISCICFFFFIKRKMHRDLDIFSETCRTIQEQIITKWSANPS